MEREERELVLKDIFGKFARGRTFDELRDDFSHVSPRVLDHAESYIVAHYPDLYSETQGILPEEDFRILIDENLAPGLVSRMYPYLGETSHTMFEKLTGCPDPIVWAEAVNREFDAIITKDKAMRSRDRDLTLIAVDAAENMMRRMAEKDGHVHEVDFSELPLIVQVRGVEGAANHAALLLDNIPEISAHIHHRDTPYIHVSRSGVTSGPSYAELDERLNWLRGKPKAIVAAPMVARDFALASRWAQRLGYSAKTEGRLQVVDRLMPIAQRCLDTVL